MIHPSYVELMKVLNDDVVIGEEPVVNSRYSIVCAAAKRARQIIDGSEPMLDERDTVGVKPLSMAVKELSDGDLKILNSEEAKVEEDRLFEISQETKTKREQVEKLRAEKEAEQEASKAAQETEAEEEQ